jgi:alpha-L-rhamnosidase
MAKYVGYLGTRASGGLVAYDSGLGDWGENTVTTTHTPTNLVENWGYYRDLNAMAVMAAAIGKTADATSYASQAAATLAAFRSTWYDGNAKTVANGTQAALAMALDIGAVPASDVATVGAKLASAVSSTGMAVGEIGLPPLMRALASTGNNQVLYTAATANKIGGYGYFVAQGATSLPEYWSISSGSRNHFMLGYVDQWMAESVAGLQQAPGSVGFDALVVRPSIVGGMTSASTTLTTRHGTAAVAWTVSSGKATVDVTVPVGSTATVDVPLLGATTPPVTPAGAAYVGMSGGYAEYTVGSGTWRFAA